MKYSVYWLYLADHSDPYSEGYVGITKDSLSRRLSKHHLPKKIKNLQATLLHEGLSLTKALRVEREYRPHARIGFNTCAGGGHC